ncbi:MAG: hypothetical protein GX100_13545 [candidate division WS1 bacterium]|nr:hypothetical protein [candidate division WS1 bacterium]
MHKVLGALAWRSLSEADKEAWGLSPQIPESAPDFLRSFKTNSVEEKMAQYSFFLDNMGYRVEDFRETPQFMLPGEVPVPHGAITSNLTAAASDDQLPDVWGWRHVLRTFVPRLLEQAQKGNMEEAALFAGLLSHFLQDGSCIGHVLPARLAYDLSPNDPASGHVDFHAPFDDCSPPLETVRPLLLGTTVPEIVFRLSQLGEKNYRLILNRTIPLLEACRKGDKAELDRLCQPMLQSAILQVASLLHTVVVVAKGNVPEDEAAAIGDVDLTEVEGYFIHPGSDYRVVIPRNYTIDRGKYVPLRTDLGNGPVDINPGLGMTSFHSIRYLLEPGAFARVEGQIGLSSDYLRDQEEEMEVEFFVSTAAEWNRTITPDLEYGPEMPEVYSHWLKPGRPAEPFSVELGEAQTLLFGVRPNAYRAENGWRCWYPHVVLSAPRLVKA